MNIIYVMPKSVSFTLIQSDLEKIDKPIHKTKMAECQKNQCKIKAFKSIRIKTPYFDSNLVNRNPHVINGGRKISQATRFC
jgi:hypothetical protein